jgi:hypothetical protein
MVLEQFCPPQQWVERVHLQLTSLRTCC